MNYKKKSMEVVESGIINLLYFYVFGVSILSIFFSLALISLIDLSYLLTFISTFICINFVISLFLMPYYEKICLLFDKKDKERRAKEIEEMLKLNPNYYDNGLSGGIKSYLKYVKSKLIRN